MTGGCPACGQVHTIPAGSEGKLFGCLKCQARMVVRGNRLLPADEPPKTVMPPPAALPPPPPAAKNPPTASSFPVLADSQPTGLRYAGGGTTLGDYLMFRRLITPMLIVVLFWVGTAGIVGSGLLTMASNLTSTKVAAPVSTGKTKEGKDAGPATVSESNFSIASFLSGLATVLLGPIAWRIACESIIVVYRIQEDLATIRESRTRPPTA